MKKFIYSTYTKAFAVILFLASLTLGVFSGVRCGELILAEGDYIYDFGEEPEDSFFIRHMISLPERAVLGACWEYTEEIIREPATEEPSSSWESTVPSVFLEHVPVGEEFLKLVKQGLEGLPYEGWIEYYVNLNGVVFTNTDVTEPETLAEGLYKFYAIDRNGNVKFDTTRVSYAEPFAYDGYGLERLEIDSLTIVSKISDHYVSEYKAMWERQEQILYTAGARVLICALTLLLSLIYLICVCGKDKDGNRKESWVDRIWAEFHLLFMGAFAFGCLLACVGCVDAAFEERLSMEVAYLIPGLLIPLTGGLILSSLLSMIRNLKAGIFAKRSCVLLLLKKLLAFFWFLCKALRKGICHIRRTIFSARKIPFVLSEILLLLLYTIFIVAIVAKGTEGALIFLFLLFGFGVYLLTWTGKDLNNIKKGAAQIRNGNLSYEIPKPSTNHLKALAEDVNQIAKGLDASLAGRLKAERMKTELITNVSHDLKTPLTSIINYTELLSKVEELPEEAQDYIRIIGDKSQRLKNLTQDLFAISKVPSGTAEVNWELLDAAILLEQSLAEEKGENTAEALPFCLKAEDGLTFMGDGRKLSRVMGNLIQNAVKYAMPGTRVFLSAYKEEDRVVIECKNVSAYPLDFSPEEILGRFVRGDSSRSTEGNGLGLPIAKSYTELCGGDFNLLLDGDLFKVVLSFPTSQ